MLTKSINSKIEEEEKDKDFLSADSHKKEVDEVKMAWRKIEEVREKNKKEKTQIDEKWEEVENKKKKETAAIDEAWDRIEKAKAKKAAPETCKAGNNEKLEKQKQ